MVATIVSPLLGFGLGAWLAIAGVRKLIGRIEFSTTVAALFSTDVTSPRVRLISRTLPWFEIAIGVLASLFFDVVIVRLLVLGLFSLFLLALLGLSIRFKRFDCGCFGTGHTEAREVILIRAITSLLAAVCFVLSPSTVFTPQQAIWFECGAWASVFLIIVGFHARELIGDQTRSAQP